MLLRGVEALAEHAEPVEGRDAHGPGEVTIRAATRAALGEDDSGFRREGLGHAVEGEGSGIRLPDRPRDTTGNGEAHTVLLAGERQHLLDHSVEGIAKHTETIKTLITKAGGDAKPDHCKGMEGLVTEALKHGVKEAPSDGKLQDIEIIAQYQRMSHYGVAGFGSATAYAKALGKSEDAAKLKSLVGDIYKADEYASKLAEHLEKVAA